MTEQLMTAVEARACTERIRRRDNEQRRDLLEMDDRKGWEALDYPSWRAWAVAEFGQSERHLYRQLEAAKIERNICPNGQIGSIPEGQLRPLAALWEDDQPSAWQQAVETAPAGKVTAAHVRQVVQELLPDHLDRMEKIRQERERLHRLKEELQIPDVDQEAERARINLVYSFFRAVETLADLPSPAEVAALIRPDQEYHLRGIVAAHAWLAAFISIWEQRR